MAPLPLLPAGTVAASAREMRSIDTPCSREAWCHPGWRQLVVWISENKPGCDPVVPAIHAIRRAERVRKFPSQTSAVATYILKVADTYSIARRSSREVPMGLDLAEEREIIQPGTQSLSIEAAQLLGREGIGMSSQAWNLVSEGIDIAVDWWIDVANSTGMAGSELVATVTGDASHLSSGRRLRQYFDGPAGRPLVALLLGTDQLGSVARRQAGRQPSLVMMSLEARQAASAGQTLPRPAPSIVRAWKTAVGRIDSTFISAADRGTAPEPFVAA